MYIYQHSDWPHFYWDITGVTDALLGLKLRQGRLLGRLEHLGLSIQAQAALVAMTAEVVKTSEIEGEVLNSDAVRSSIARHQGMDIAGLLPVDRQVDGIVEVLLDATQNYQQPLTEQRLCQWHSSMFSRSISGMMLVNAGVWRRDAQGPMQVVSGRYGREKIHFQAPPAVSLLKEIAKFLQWFEDVTVPYDALIKAAITHLWFVTLHPFNDGNGRLARAITDMALARAEHQANRFYSMSRQIRQQQKSYYSILESTQKGTMDITAWLMWFLDCLDKAILQAEELISNVLNKAKFWEQHAEIALNSRQVSMLNILFDGLRGKLTTSKWAKMMKCSQDTALRDINALLKHGILIKSVESGRSANYLLKDFPINHIE